MADRKVQIKNMSRNTIVFIVENSNYLRKFDGEGAIIHIPFDILFEGLSEKGVMTLFEEGALSIIDKQDRIDLGLETADEESKFVTLTSEEMLTILNKNNAVELKETLTKLPLEQQKKFATVAVENNITNYGISQIIKNITGIDVIRNVQIIEEMKADEEAAKNNK